MLQNEDFKVMELRQPELMRFSLELRLVFIMGGKGLGGQPAVIVIKEEQARLAFAACPN